MLANIYLKDEDKCIRFCDHAFHPFITEPDMFMQVDENWHSMVDYMQSLSSKYRVRTKKIISTSAMALDIGISLFKLCIINSAGTLL